MQKLELTFNVESFRKIPNPYLKSGITESTPEMFIVICDVTKLPHNIPMETNPREQNLNKGVAKKIKESLTHEENLDFYLLNRGLLLSVKECNYNNYSNELTLVFEDFEVHGDIDGGHTYKIIQNESQFLEEKQQYVKLEILRGVEDIFQRLAAARNTSTQVQDKSIAELYDRFDLIKDAIIDEPYADDVYFKENDNGSIDVADMLAILNMFNLDKYENLDQMPVVSYNSKKKCIDLYIDYHKKYQNTVENPYIKMKPVIKDIFKLYDKLETSMSAYYKEETKNGKYGAIKGVGTMKGTSYYKSKFYYKDMIHSTPKSFLYPILGSLRALLEEKDGFYRWKSDPFAALDNLGKRAVTSTVELSRQLGNNPNAAGKNLTLWQSLYMFASYKQTNN